MPGNPTQSKVQANQVVTLPTDPGRVYYVATDEDGNFYVGDQFKVEQATGKATLDSSAFDLTSESLQLGSIGDSSVHPLMSSRPMEHGARTAIIKFQHRLLLEVILLIPITILLVISRSLERRQPLIQQS